MLTVNQKRSYNFYDKEDKTEENLIENDEFLTDAREFLTKRERYSVEDLDTPQEVYDAYMEHFRFQNVNEITAIRDLEYAQNSNSQEKEQFARLIDLFETQKSEGFFDAAGDYVQGVLTAPSTYLGIATGGAGKLATAGATQVAKLGLKKLLTRSIAKSALKGAAVEGGIGVLQGTAQEMTKEETGYTDEVSLANIALTGGVSALTGGAISGVTGGLQTGQALKAASKLETSQAEAAKLAVSANTKAKATLVNKGKQQKYRKQLSHIRNQLNSLDPEKVAIGNKLMDDITQAKELGTLKGKLPTNLTQNIAAAALDLADKGDFVLKKGERITTTIQKAISDGKLKTNDMLKILKEYNLSADEFSLIYKAELSEAGRTLGVQGNLVQSLKELENSGVSTVGGREAKEIMENAKAIVGTPFKDLDRLRLGLMTSQPATTMRNNINAGLRVAVDAGVRTIHNIFRGKNPFSGVFDLSKYMFNPYEANVTRLLLEQARPDVARKLFRDAADLEAATGAESKIASLGTKMNKLNTLSDNFFKQAMLSASLKRRLADQGKDFAEIIEKGRFNIDVDNDLLNAAIKDAQEFVYQSSFEGADKGFLARGTRSFLKAHRDMPFILSSFIPFPRYIANQMQFLYEHAPLIGMLGLENIGKKAGWAKTTLKMPYEEFSKKLAKQSAGFTMLVGAYYWREAQGDTSYWYEFKDDQGNFIDGRAVYGPFAPFMLGADILFRWNKSNVGGEKDMSEIAETDSTYWRDALQALAGSQFRTGYGMYAIDRLYQDVTSEGDFIGTKGSKIAGEFLGNVLNTFMIPVSVVKDIYSAFDKESRYVPETRKGEVDLLDIMINRGFRALPDFGPNTAVGRFFGDGEYDMSATSPLRSGYIQSVNPIEKQLFGFTKRPEKNILQKEMGKLNLQYFDIYKRDNNEMIDLYTRQNLSRVGSELNLNETLKNLIQSEAYKNTKTNQEKRSLLLDKAKTVVNEAKSFAKAELDKEASVEGGLSETQISTWNKTPQTKKKTANTIYKRMMRTGELSFADGLPYDLKNLESNLNRLVRRKGGQILPLYQWAMEVMKVEKVR